MDVGSDADTGSLDDILRKEAWAMCGTDRKMSPLLLGELAQFCCASEEPATTPAGRGAPVIIPAGKDDARLIAMTNFWFEEVWPDAVLYAISSRCQAYRRNVAEAPGRAKERFDDGMAELTRATLHYKTTVESASKAAQNLKARIAEQTQLQATIRTANAKTNKNKATAKPAARSAEHKKAQTDLEELKRELEINVALIKRYTPLIKTDQNEIEALQKKYDAELKEIEAWPKEWTGDDFETLRIEQPLWVNQKPDSAENKRARQIFEEFIPDDNPIPRRSAIAHRYDDKYNIIYIAGAAAAAYQNWYSALSSQVTTHASNVELAPGVKTWNYHRKIVNYIVASSMEQAETTKNCGVVIEPYGAIRHHYAWYLDVYNVIPNAPFFAGVQNAADMRLDFGAQNATWTFSDARETTQAIQQPVRLAAEFYYSG
jgi:hypothetical protein